MILIILGENARAELEKLSTSKRKPLNHKLPFSLRKGPWERGGHHETPASNRRPGMTKFRRQSHSQVQLIDS